MHALMSTLKPNIKHENAYESYSGDEQHKVG